MWFKWVLVGLLVLAPMLTILEINKPRKLLTPSMALTQVIFNVLVILGVLHYWGQ